MIKLKNLLKRMMLGRFGNTWENIYEVMVKQRQDDSVTIWNIAVILGTFSLMSTSWSGEVQELAMGGTWDYCIVLLVWEHKC